MEAVPGKKKRHGYGPTKLDKAEAIADPALEPQLARTVGQSVRADDAAQQAQRRAAFAAQDFRATKVGKPPEC